MDMNDLGVWDPLSVKGQTVKTAIEVSDSEKRDASIHLSLCSDGHFVAAH